ncbi:MAG: hypothetical protein CL468_07465 [Acidimicrobiaceae bacterium]|mgnify:FL=1|nr:hypothetical protein [Acidimicrobiaceae bacterium]|tara:strand:- start:7798 stop:8427 length:630 start_codon:yes stop_codon:yes gene_type:complete
MLLWNRQLTISPDSFNAGMAGMVDAVTHVNSVSDYEFALWAPVLGTFGRVGISSRCEDFGPFADEMAERGVQDDAFRAKIDAVGPCMAGNPEDTLWQILHIAGEMGALPNVLTYIRWQAAPSQLMAAVEFATGMADFSSGITGATTTVSACQWGYPNGIGLITGYDSVSAQQAASIAVGADSGFAERLAASADIGRPETIETGVLRRIV